MRYKRNHSTAKSSRKPLLVVAVLLLLASGGAYAFQNDLFNNTSDNNINQPPTEQEKAAGDVKKEEIVAEEKQRGDTQSTDSDAPKNSVSPFITVWRGAVSGSDLKVNGYVQGVIETGGTCSLTLTHDGQTVTGSNEAFRDAQDTNCGQITIPGSKLSPGTWQAVLSYSSSTSEGKSKNESIEVK